MLVRRGQGREDLRHNGDDARQGEVLLRLQGGRERPALEELHDEERVVVGVRAEVVDRHDVPVSDPSRQARFPDEALPSLLVSQEELGADQLDRDGAL